MKYAMKLHLLVFSLVQIGIFFSASTSHALTPISAEQACNKASSYYAIKCTPYINLNNYYDGYAAAACGNASSFYVPSCIQAIANKRYKRNAVESCARVDSFYLRGCLLATANKEFTAETIQRCSSSFSAYKTLCYNNSPSRAIHSPSGKPTHGLTPISAEQACNKASSYYATECSLYINLNNYYDGYAAAACGNVSSLYVPNCIQAISNKRYKRNVVESCARVDSFYLRGCLLATANKEFTAETIQRCNSSSSAYKTLCYKNSPYRAIH